MRVSKPASLANGRSVLHVSMPSTSNRTIEPLVSVFSSAEIRVAILPFGIVPEAIPPAGPVSKKLLQAILPVGPVSMELLEAILPVGPVSMELLEAILTVGPVSKKLLEAILPVGPVSMELLQAILPVGPVPKKLLQAILPVGLVPKKLQQAIPPAGPVSKKLLQAILPVGPVPEELLEVYLEQIRIFRHAILPVGPVPEELLEVYSEQIRNFHHVSLSATRSFYREPNQKTPFQHIDWKDGHMRFRFLNAEEARRKTRILDLHPSRKVAAVIGVVHCPMAPNIEQAYAQFQDISSQYPEAYVHRCFVFEPSEDHIRQESQHLKNLVMFPPGQSHLEQHLEVWMHDLAALVLTELERWMLTSGPSVIKPGGYADSSEFTGQSAVIEEVNPAKLAMSARAKRIDAGGG
eukprot:gene5284-18530_t